MSESKPTLIAPDLGAPTTTWGPCGGLEVFAGIPYQTFSKQDKIGKVADFAHVQFYQRGDRPTNAYGGGDAFAYVHDGDDKAFQLVDTTKVQGTTQKLRPKKFQFKRVPDGEVTNRGAIKLKKDKNRERDRQKLEQKLQKKWGQTAKRRFDRRQRRNMSASLRVKETWTEIKEIELEKLDLATLEVTKVKDLYTCGKVNIYDRTFDKLTPKTARGIMPARVQYATLNCTTSEDPIMNDFISKKTAKVYATDFILGCLMAARYSVYTWDIVVRKDGDTIIFDKRDGSQIDDQTVDESAFQPPIDEGDHINSAESLARESGKTNTDVKRTVLLSKKSHSLGKPNPFEGTTSETLPSVAYRYRLYDFEDDCTILVRGEHDALVPVDKKAKFAAVKAILEWDPVANGRTDWRTKLLRQHGTVIATELRNNKVKLARWAFQSMLAGNGVMKLVYASRSNAESVDNHVILGTETFVPAKLASDLKVSLDNGWGIVRSLINLFQAQEDGTYVILKEPLQQVIKIFAVAEEDVDQAEEDFDDMEDSGPVGILDVPEM
jgi:translation initiation factor 3 subunit D